MNALVFLVVIPALLAPALSSAEVTIVRRLPPAGDSVAEATWLAPRPETASGQEGMQVSGRLSTGAVGGVDAAGDTRWGFITDSEITLVRPLGDGAALRLDAGALRENLLDGTEQAYEGKIAVLGEKLAADVVGGYRRSDRIVDGAALSDIDGTLEASISSSAVPTLPVALSYKGAWTDLNGENTTERTESHGLRLSADGMLGKLGTELSWVLNREVLPDGASETLGTSGRLFFSLPVASFAALRAGIAPSHTDTSYASTGNSARTTALLSSMGLVFLISEGVETYLSGGIINSRREELGPSAAPDGGPELALQGELGADIRELSGLSSGSFYRIVRTDEGGLSHAASANVLWQGTEDTVFKSAEAGGELTFSTSSSGSVLLDDRKWKLSLNAVPARRMSLTGSYQGGRRREQTSEKRQHQAAAAFSHDPVSIFGYKASFTISGVGEDTEEDLIKHASSAEVYLKPPVGPRSGTIGLQETFSVSRGDSGTDRLSKATALVAVPVTEAVRLGYQLGWEWMNRTEIAGGPGNVLRHEFNTSFTGRDLPVSLSARYAFTHGYRGPRHDCAAQLSVPLRRGYEVRSAFELGHYDQNGRTMTPFLFELELARSF